MTEQKSKNTAIPFLIMVVLLADVGLVVWAWHLHQMKQAKYSATGLNVASAPHLSLPAMNFALQTPDAPMADPSRNIIKSPELRFDGRLSSSKAGNAARNADAPAYKQARPQTRRLIIQAQSIYFALKRNPRFKNSPVIQAWKKDFLSYPDLKAINDQYRKDKDGTTFLVRMVRSPNFGAMLGKYVRTPDIQDFIKSMRESPVVAAAAENFLSDFNLQAMLKRLPAADEAGHSQRNRSMKQ